MSGSVLQNVIHPPHGIGGEAGRKSGIHEPDEDFPQDGMDLEMETVLGVLVENAPVAMAMFDREMRYVLANRAWIEEFSLQEVQPLIGRSQYEIFPAMHPGWREVYERGLSGHVVRSEHDEIGGEDGGRLVYRWEVRPWRRNKDASVGGLMVTCEKFAAMPSGVSALPPELPMDSRSEQVRHAPDIEMPPSALPLVLVDENCVIHQANTAAVELCLARGLREGASLFAEMFTSGRDIAAFQSLWQKALDKLESGSSGAMLPVPGAHERMSGESELPERWLLSPSGKSGDRMIFLAVGMPRGQGHDPVPRPAAMPAAPDLPAIASAVASIRQPSQQTPADPSANLEVRRLQDDLARTRQEMRTLREAEHLFAQKETRGRQYLDLLPCGVLVLDESGAPVFQNEPLSRLLGRPVRKDETVENWLAAACPGDEGKQETSTIWREDVWRRQLTRIFSLVTADGLLKELEFQPCALPGGGLLVCIQDATEHCRREEQLRASEAKFRAMFHDAPVAVILTDKTGSVFEANPRAEAMLGRSKSELRRLPPGGWMDAPDIERRKETLRQLQASGDRSASLDIRLVRAGADPMPCAMTLAQVLDADGLPHNTVHFLQPAGSAQTGQKLEGGTSTTSLKTKAPSAIPPASGGPGVFLLRTNVNGRIQDCSPRGLELLGLEAGQAKGRALHLHFRPSDATGFYSELAANSQDERTFECLQAGGERASCRLLARACGGGGFDVELFEAGGDDLRQLSDKAPPNRSTADSPALKPWPAADLSREKLLLSETHHRIKNHLQIISSLLNLESNTVQDSAARGALRSSQNRVRAIAELHQHLYQLALGSNSSFADFAAGLVQRLRDCFDVPESQVSVKLKLQDGGIQQEWLMPLALVLNETLSNCFEHAFPGRRSGTVEVTLSLSGDGGQLVVSDDGIGLAGGFATPSSQGLGLKILSVFAEQMRGRLEIGASPQGGTKILLRFSMASTDI
ncbi:MAG TPA: hypothetical protein DIT13_17160 [Verrucomicrobiales bacterium]|nr:hypothetical protein [Verrucomicrobiales bacterium]HRK14710.1 PAS domain-containing protein [Prosthecobacter sp.]